ncbi:MAG: hypothetical protein WCD70_16275 [Alphaproteobacteria bacterium]
MTNLFDLPWLLLMGTFWQGFSLFFFLTFAVLWVKFYPVTVDGQGQKKSNAPPFWKRMVVALPGFVGSFGTAAHMGAFGTQIHGGDIVFVLGFPIGILVALFIRRGIEKSSKVPPP